MLKTSKPGHTERFESMLKQYSFMPAKQGDSPVPCYALLIATAGKAWRDLKAAVGTDNVWGSIFLSRSALDVSKVKSTEEIYLRAVRRMARGYKNYLYVPCCRRSGSRITDLQGGVVVDVTVDSEGRIEKISQKYSSITISKARKCIVEKIKTWKFPPPPAQMREQAFEIRYHVFHTGGSATNGELNEPWMCWNDESIPMNWESPISDYTPIPWKHKDEKGKVYSEGNYLRGEQDGPWVFYFDNGDISSKGTYKQGYRTGHWVRFYKNEIKQQEGDYVDGRKDGLWKYWHENGELQSTGEFIDGKAEGLWIYFQKDGTLKDKIIFKNGKPFSR